MRFRPCIDIHDGKVKQIVGSSLVDQGDYSSTKDNFVAGKDADWYAQLYKEKGLTGGHVIMLNKAEDTLFPETKRQALLALSTYPGHLQIGGGINDQNASEYLEAGASHVIVTSFVFRQGHIDMERLTALRDAVGKEHLVLDLSVRARGEKYYVATERWQNISEEALGEDLLVRLSEYCDEFLIHAADVEGQVKGPEQSVLALLSEWEGIPITYAGGIRDMKDIETIRTTGGGRIDFTVGTALDIFGGSLDFEGVCRI